MTDRAAESLAYAVRGSALVRHHGDVATAFLGIAAIPAIFALLAGQWDFAASAGLAAALLGAIGLLSRRVSAPARLQSNEALVVVALAYLLTATLMSWPMRDGALPLVDAFFHSISAITTTGLSTVGSIEKRSPAFLFTQAWMQWYGGLVVVVLAVLLMGPGESARRLSGTEQDESDLASGTWSRARWALRIYATLTVVGFCVLLAFGVGGFDALLSALSGVSTGGFSPHDGSLADFGPWSAQASLILLSLAGAVPLARYRDFASRSMPARERWRAFFDLETRSLLLLCLLVAVLLFFLQVLSGPMPWKQAMATAPLLAISAQSTAGFTPVDVGSLDASSKLLLTVSMFIGGGQGSTAGGIKILRLLLMLRLLQVAVLRPALPPHAVVRPGLGERGQDDAYLRQALGVVGVFASVVLLSWAAFVAHGYDALDSLFEVVSASGTVGLSTGLSGPGLEPLLKLVLCADMWMGRLEILAVLVLLHPRTWAGRRASKS